MTAKRKTRRHRLVRRRPRRGGVDLAITYVGGPDRERDRAISAAVGSHGTGSGYSFADDERNVTATVPADELPRVVRALRKIPDVVVKKRVVAWVLA